MTCNRFLTATHTIWLPVAAHSAEPPPIARLCSGCHGSDGITRDVSIPNIAGQSGIYHRSQFQAFRSGRRKHPQMSISASALTDRDIDQIVTHYALMPAR